MSDARRYVIETRKPETDYRPAGEWTTDGMGGTIEVSSEEEGQSVIESLRGCGPDWAEADYRIRPL